MIRVRENCSADAIAEQLELPGLPPVDEELAIMLDIGEDRLTPEQAAAFYTMAGRCSGIPECCIAEFVRRPQGPPRPLSERERDRDDAASYLRCGACRSAGVVVEMRLCRERLGVCRCLVAKAWLFEVRRDLRLDALRLAERVILRLWRPAPTNGEETGKDDHHV